MSSTLKQSKDIERGVLSSDLERLYDETEGMIDSIKASLTTPQKNLLDDSNAKKDSDERDLQNTYSPNSSQHSSSFFSDDGITKEVQTLDVAMSLLKEEIQKFDNYTHQESFQSHVYRQYVKNELATLQVADSVFLGYICPIRSSQDALHFRQKLKKIHPNAAHIPFAFITNQSSGKNHEGFDEDGEPENSVGPYILEELQRSFQNISINTGFALCIVRYFESKLLGVTCGRLSRVYQECSILSIYRYIHGKTSCMDRDLTKQRTNHFGLGAGDCELLLDIFKDTDVFDDFKSEPHLCVNSLVNELQFDGFRGNTNEELPRLQNLQADTSKGVIPVYRYPGNYRGDEWMTFQWSLTSSKIRGCVEKTLKPLVIQQMNHCVTNFYRDGQDFIAHHSDKDLDLDREGVIVSVSIGDERILELKRRNEPRDCTQIILPHGSMLVLGPKTNRFFTHSILQKPSSSQPRISLTFRHVLSFMDLKTGYIFGNGASLSTLEEVRLMDTRDNFYFLIGVGHIGTVLWNIIGQRPSHKHESDLRTGLTASLLATFSYCVFKKVRRYLFKIREEKQARDFFSNASVHGTKY